jgi:hypothetical protein
VGHHVKVLERAGLVRVVRTRQVRAVTEKYYGRVARLFVMKGEEPREGLTSVMLRRAAEEAGEPSDAALLHARLAPADAERFQRRLRKLMDDFRARESADGEAFGFAFALYRTKGTDA